MNAHAHISAAEGAGGLSTLAWTQQRRAHVMAALEARRTAHEWLRMARQYPRDAARCRVEARKRRDAARWNLAKARNIDAWLEWRTAA